MCFIYVCGLFRYYLVARFLPDYPIFVPADTQLGNLLIILCDNYN